MMKLSCVVPIFTKFGCKMTWLIRYIRSFISHLFYNGEKRLWSFLFFLSSTKVHWKFSANNNLVMFFRINTARLRFVTPSSWVQLNFAICFVENFFCLALKKSCLCKIATKKMFTKIKLYNLNCFTGIFFSRPILI